MNSASIDTLRDKLSTLVGKYNTARSDKAASKVVAEILKTREELALLEG